jgi:hypothetical protein
VKKSNMLALALVVMLSGGVSSAQTSGPRTADGGGCSCPNPVNINITKSSGPTSGLQSDYPANFAANQMTYNDPRFDLHFTDTIRWDLPKGSCQLTSGVVTWTVKNTAANGIQDNDSTGLWINGAQLPGSGHTIPIAPGTTKTFTYTLTPAQMRTGRVSLAVQDDTAVLNFSVAIRGCCITPN